MAAVKHGPKHVDRNEVDRKVGKISVLLSLLVRALWLVLAISWPILRWLLAVDITFLFTRIAATTMRYGLYFDWIFWGHFFLYVVLNCIVISHKSR
ncbi:MAG: hypothetical protein KGM95_09280 [Betaproteobacteria bacterium]|nr:hypothetical protein [Betaproteobacteria bacterium]